MADCMVMMKYQGLGNDYLVLDPQQKRRTSSGKEDRPDVQRGFGLGADGVLYGPVDINGKMGVHIYNAGRKRVCHQRQRRKDFRQISYGSRICGRQEVQHETLAGSIEVECLTAGLQSFG